MRNLTVSKDKVAHVCFYKSEVFVLIVSGHTKVDLLQYDYKWQYFKTLSLLCKEDTAKHTSKFVDPRGLKW